MISPNVIITKNYDTIKRIFFGPKSMGDAKKQSLSEVLKSIENDDETLICAPGSNDVLLELDFNMPQGNVPNGYINAKFLETKKTLEYFLLDQSNLETQFNFIRSLDRKAGVSLDENLKKLNRFYIAFGTGDNLNEWAGPFVVTIGAANMVLENNVKIITIGFINSGDLQSVRGYTSKLYGNLGFEGEKLNAMFPRGTEMTFAGSIKLDMGLSERLGPRIKKRHYTKRVLNPEYSWNPWIRELLMSYIGSVYDDGRQAGQPNRRVMVLLSEDFDKIFNKKIEGTVSLDFERNYASQLWEMGIRLCNIDDTENATQAWYQKKTKSYDDYYKRQGNSDATRDVPTEVMELYENGILQEADLKMESVIKTGADEKNPELIMDPIFNFIGGLKRNQSSSKDFVLFELNDAEIIDMLDKAAMSGNGFLLGAGPGDSKIIFGEVDLVKKLIFLSDEGKSNLENDFGKMFSEPRLDGMDWDQYRKDFKDTILARERIQNSSFKEKLDFGPFDTEFQEIKEVSDMIFLHGVKNSNVQSVTFTKDVMQGALMNFNVTSAQRSPVVNSFLREVVKNDDFKIADLVSYLESKGIFTDDVITSKVNLIEFLNDLARNPDSEEATKFKKLEDQSTSNRIARGRESTQNEFNNYVDILVGYARLMKEHSGNLPTVDVGYSDSNGESPRGYEAYVDLFNKSSELINQITVKTLPFFNQKNYFERNCYFFSLYNDIIRSSNDENYGKFKTLLNGSYIIKGARHFMSHDNAFSEFELVKASVENDSLNADTTKSLSEAAAREESGSKEGAPKKVTPNEELTRQKIAERLHTKYENT